MLKPFSVCVTPHNNTVILSSSRTPGQQRGKDMETLTKKDPPPPELESCNKEEFTGWYETNADSAGVKLGGVTLICSCTPA